jgi:hypothetical protein
MGGEQGPKPPLPNFPEVATPMRLPQQEPHRLSQLKPCRIGEQVVGSRHHFPIAAPVSFDWDAGSAMAAVSISGSPDIEFVWPPMSALRPLEVAPPIDVIYAPKDRGTHSAELVFAARWRDGHVEQQRLSLVGSAHELTDVLENPATSTKVPLAADPPVQASKEPDNSSYTKREDDELKKASRHLDTALGRLYRKQIAGVTSVKEEQAEFVRVKSHSVWWDLAEVAVEIGTTALAAYLFPILEAELIAGGIAGLESKAGESVAHGISHAFMKEVGAASKKILEPADEADEKKMRSETVANSHPMRAFFKGQADVLGDASDAMSDESIDREYGLRAANHSNPMQTASALTRATAAVQQAGSKAESEQARATSLQLLAFKARLELGDESVRSGSGIHPVTKMDDARHGDRVFDDPRTPDGLLDIRVTLTAGKPHVHGARVEGVSREVVERLLDADLANARIPMRITLNGVGHITRDEAGRIRYSGFVPLDADMTSIEDELSQIRGAQRIADEVLSRSLKGWGVASIETDDASK